MLIEIQNVALEIVSAFVSKKRVSIEKRLEGLISEKRIARLKKQVGFEELSIAEENICSSDFCAAAAEKIFAETEISREEISAVIFVTQTPDYFLPSTAHLLQQRLQLSRNVAAFDVGLGCSGFVYGLYVAASIVQNLPNGKILLLCGDTVTRNIFFDDVSCLSVFGDAGTAAIVSKAEGEKIFFNLQSFGELSDGIILRRGAYRNPALIENNSLNVRENFVTMDGAQVLDFSIKYVPPNLTDLMNFAKINPAEVGNFFMHQANKMILQDIAFNLNLPVEKFPFKSERIGNTSSASIPVTLAEMARRGDNFKTLSVMSGFGVGMSIASAVIDLKNLMCISTGEI